MELVQQSSLVERVKAIMLTPKTEWPVIEREPGDMVDLFRNYVAILAAIPAVCGFVGTALVGFSVPVVGTVRAPIGAALVSAIIGYVLSFVMVYVLAYIIDALAPAFGGQKNFGNALKTAVYSFTPGWLVGVFMLIPALGFLGILALYGIYLVWTGLPVMMRSPQEKTLGYTGAVVAVALVVGLVFGMVQAAAFRV